MKWEVSSSYFYVLENQRMFGVKPRNEFWRCHFWGHVENFPFLLATICVNIYLSETRCSYGAFLMFCQLKKGKLKLTLHHSLVQCFATVWALCRKQLTPQLWMEGRGEGCGLFCFQKLPHLKTVSQWLCCQL